MAILCISKPAFSEARFMDLEELAAISDFIGVIDIESTEQIGQVFDEDLPRRGYWTYSQKNSFIINSIIKESEWIKIDTKRSNILWAEKSFICASASYRPGRYLVFLESVGPEEWITLNHQLGALGIENDSVEFGWYTTRNKDRFNMPLDKAERKIRECFLNSPTLTIEADITPELIYNAWHEGREFQKLWFHVYNPPSRDWPKGLTNFTRSFIKSEIVDYKDIAKRGGRYKIKAYWEMGYLIVESIEPKK